MPFLLGSHLCCDYFIYNSVSLASRIVLLEDVGGFRAEFFDRSASSTEVRVFVPPFRLCYVSQHTDVRNQRGYF